MSDSLAHTEKVTDETTAIVACTPSAYEVQGLRQTASELLDLVGQEKAMMVMSCTPSRKPTTLLDLASQSSRRVAHLSIYDLLLHTLARQRDRPSIYESERNFRRPKPAKIGRVASDPHQPLEFPAKPQSQQQQEDVQLVTNSQAIYRKDTEQMPLLDCEKDQPELDHDNSRSREEEQNRLRGGKDQEEDCVELLTQ